MINKFFYTCLSGLLLTCSFGYSQPTTLTGSDNSWRIAINPNGTIRSYETYRNGVWDSIPFRNDNKSGPRWDGIDLSLVDKNNLLFEGTQNQITYRLQYTSAGNHLAIKAEITNHSQVEFAPLAARLIVGVNSEMRTFPDWNNKFFPTLLRCEKTHLWGYFMSPTQRILGICTAEPVASYNLNYIQEGNMWFDWGHQIRTASLALLHKLPLPARHPQDLASLRPGEKKQWTIHLGEIDKLENVKPTLALWGNNPLLECSQYTVAEGETITYKLFGCDNKNSTIELLTPLGKVMPVAGNSISFKDGKGVYTIRLTAGAKTSEAMVNVRENWSWYLKNAGDHVFKYPPIVGLSCEQIYGYYTAFIGAKYFPDKAKDKMLIQRFEKQLAMMWDTVAWTPNPDAYPHRLQNHSTTMGILAKLWEATHELRYLELAAHIADYLASDKVQTPDGVYRSHKTYYTAVIYPAKSMLDLALCEKRLIAEPVWKERYERHFNSAARAINDLLIRRDDIDTEGDLTFEDGMVSCCALQIGLLGLWQENEELKNVYANAAKYVLNKHQCLEQLQIPDTRMRGATLRYWEALDIYFLPNQVMNSPHGWTGWKIYASYYLYLLTGDEFYLRDFMDTLGAAAQIMAPTGKLRWAFLPDPFVKAKILVQNPQQPRAALQVDSVVGEQYLDMISPWYRPDDESGFHFFGQGQDGLGKRGSAGDNTVQEIFKVMEECALTQAYLIVREDGSFQAWNCKATKKGATIDVVPNERYIDKLHVNSKIPTTVTVSLNGKKHKQEVTGMQWIGEQPPFLLTQSASSASAQRLDLTARQDTSRILLNPDKGWYHHYLDNSITDDTVVTRYAAKGYKFPLDINSTLHLGCFRYFQRSI
ncbi:hypothetical protein [Candidatus Symbiothrix dinenymphae]|uniref:hypothetical protein n=1 Tax=Candidatus Symbiothrix dinenymphae TaxID=467085 RepID=UPI00070294E1|nr:hypothetical protein [Candidatus Symbiothrix dinenymphae]